MEGLRKSVLTVLTQLENVIRENKVLPGGGYSEVACAKRLTERMSAGEGPDVVQSSSSWMRALMDECRAVVYRAVAEGLTQFAVVVVHNSHPDTSEYEARCRVELMKNEPVSLKVLDQCTAKMECMKSAAELVRLLLIATTTNSIH